MAAININFINNSNDVSNSQIVIFQENVTPPMLNVQPRTAVAWNVIQGVKQGASHLIVFPTDLTVAASDSFGNVTPQLPAANGQRFDMVSTVAGNQLHANPHGPANKFEIEMHNELPVGAISAMVFRNGLLLAEKKGLGPGQKAAFQFYPEISIVVVSEVVQGEIMNEAILADINTVISLQGIASADLVMTGGGIGSSATPFNFALQNVKYA